MNKPEDKETNSLAEYTAQLQNTLSKWQQDLAPLWKKIDESLQPFVEAQQWLDKSLQPMLETQKRIDKVLNSQISKFQHACEQTLFPVLETIAESFNQLPERTRNTLRVLGSHGWYLDFEMSLADLWELVEEALEKGNVEEAEQALVRYYQERLPHIRESLTEKYPARAPILRSAFAAHERGEYELSIPIFLMQSDGICLEKTSYQLFSRRNNQPATASYVNKIAAADTLLAAILYPLSCSLPISASAYERGADFNHLNRHQVLHGESIDYGTEKNSLKAISLLNYIAYALELNEEDE